MSLMGLLKSNKDRDFSVDTFRSMEIDHNTILAHLALCNNELSVVYGHCSFYNHMLHHTKFISGTHVQITSGKAHDIFSWYNLYL